eukprot:2027427-Pyramimonas_sp.AAC.1
MHRKLRSAYDVAVPAWVPYRTTCPMLSADDLRSAAKTFPAGTATSFDYLHPRHLRLLGDDGPMVLST